MASLTEPEIRLAEPLPAQFAVGKGQYLVLRGEINWQGHRVSEMSVKPNQKDSCRAELFSGREGNGLEFFVSIPWLPVDVGKQFTLTLTLTSDTQERATLELGSIEIIYAVLRDVLPASTIGDQPLVAICMASYNPESERLARQVESILCQSYGNWLLIISDDNSKNSALHEIEAICNSDPRRIRLYRHAQNVGFYHNFERALTYLPDNAALVAFADQDDEWYPEKLQNLVFKLNSEPDAILAYSDMRIVSESGKSISDTYWQNRKNEYRDFATVFIANTVTGAASLFKRELLDVVLPFPVSVGEVFHDHWVACSAMCCGKISYISEPLYDYIQYHDSVIGHCDFDFEPVSQRLSRVLNPFKAVQGASSDKWENIYRQDCLRLQLIADTLKNRFPEKSKNSTLNLMNGGWWSALKLSRIYLKGLIMGRTTNGAELGLIMGLLRGKPRVDSL
jgi:glycosyltransferase involved in cell wall biosynthesis